jgi:type II secretory ATPase GspE/PulE/Tfp pilus assembly ATPase PilB-like protein
VYEVLRITPSVQERIRRGENGERLVQGLPESSFRSLHETARQLVEQNVTDWQEVEPALL